MKALQERDAVSKRRKSILFFKSLTLFANMAEKDIALFSEASLMRAYPKGKILYVEGEEAKFFYIICHGWLRLFHTTEEGEEVILTMLTKNSITGEHAIFEDGLYTSSAQVVESSQVLCIPLALLRAQIRENNQLAFNMLTSLVQYQRRHELQMEKYLLYTAPQRIGCFLLGLCPALEQKDGVVLNLPYDKALIASALGMKGATFSRALNILRDETGIQIIGTRVTIDSLERLLTFVNGCYSRLDMRESVI